jgi:inhibitor of cysteine peptidase
VQAAVSGKFKDYLPVHCSPEKHESVNFSALVITFLGLTFASSGVAASPKTITAADVGRLITLGVGEELVIKLECNPSTGYEWLLTNAKNSVLSSRGKPTYTQRRAMPGAGGIESWNFRAAVAGAETLKLEYQRPWEKNTPPAKTVIFHITVR